MKVPLDAALRATEAALCDGDSAPATLRVSTDTRTLEAGDTFVALRGEHYDGHDFAAEAVRRGAAMLVLERPVPQARGVPAMLVPDCQRAYMALAGCARDLFRGRVVAITGSTGKTTTKAFLARLLAARYGNRVLAAPGNENNEIGVSKLLLRADNAEHDVLVVEIGARRYGDVAALVEIARPDVGILTNVGEAHLEIMGTRERLAETKWDLFVAGARAVLNADDAVSCERAATMRGQAHWFVAAPEGGSLERYERLQTLTALVGDRHLLTRAEGRALAVEVHLRVPGEYNRANAAAAIAGALELGVPLGDLAPRLSDLQPPAGRYDSIAIGGGIRLIYDAYNANASSMIAALDAFGAEAATRRIAVLASMAELGDESRVLHERVGAHAAGRVDVLVVQGEFAAELARGAERAGLGPAQIVRVGANAQAARWLREHARRGDVVLLKGSRKYKLEEIVEELQA
jgi:UDP-N-acetylmuramoyl-tripeptide--D-alanyl-D-alanine ligase